MGHLHNKVVQACGPLWQFVTQLFLWWWVLSPKSNPQAGGQCFVDSVTAYWMYYRLPSVVGGESDDIPCWGDETLLTWSLNITVSYSHYLSVVMQWCFIIWHCDKLHFRSRKLRLTTMGDSLPWQHETPLSTKVGTKFRQQVAVAQSV
jgi:hypothetical protein